MKLSTIVTAAALVATTGAANAATIVATVNNFYAGDGAYASVTNNGPTALSDVVIGGQDFGSLAAGATTGSHYLGDNEYGSNGAFGVTIAAGAHSSSGTFFDVQNDVDFNTSPISVGTLSVQGVPEPAAWALMLVGIGGIGGALRLSRKSAAAAV